MAYSELIKDFERIRDYMRQFYIYGFKRRDDYDDKSTRSYDNERRRMESWLGDYMGFHRDATGKNMFISVDSRAIPANPLYNALKAKSFTDGDIAFHFCLLDLLADGEERSLREIADAFADAYLAPFENAEPFDESTLRKKLKEYLSLGLIKAEKRGRELVYSRSEDGVALDAWSDALAFFAEVHPVGVIGSQLLDKLENAPDFFRFKHHYMLQALDSPVLVQLLRAISQRRRVEILSGPNRGSSAGKRHSLFPLRICISTQSGRQYLLGWNYGLQRMFVLRMDNIRSVKPGETEPDAEAHEAACRAFVQHLWGVSAGMNDRTEHIEMTLRAEDGEGYIVDRLQREKRCGSVEQVGAHSWRFTADVHDAAEMLPWLRTFTGRIEALECSNPQVTETFYSDLDAMLALYGGDSHALS